MLFVKLLVESFLFALHALVVNKLRTFLSLLGITIGIFAIISVFTVVDALESNVRNSVESLGANVIYVEKWPWTFGPDYPWWKYMNRPIPSYAEMQDVKRRCEHAEAVAYTISANGILMKYGNNNVENGTIVMASHEYDKIKAFELSAGRYFSLAESEAGYNLGIVGANIADQLFEGLDPVGKTILVRRGIKVKIIGVFKREGNSMMGNSSDDQVLLPINFARKLINVRSDNFQPQIQVKAAAGVSNEELIDELRGIMRNIHRLHPREEEDFALNEAKMISQQMEGLFQGIGFAGWIIGGFSILVGGFGIANIMFVSVKERTNIIGIQKSLGAKNYFILLQFLVESIVLCMIGGSLGLAFILLGTVLINSFFDMHVYLTLSNTLLGLSVSAIIGIIAGFVPAWSASRMDPVEAIRTK